MATRVNTPLAGEIWHLSIEDLFAPVEDAQRLGGDGPFVINLSVSTAPINVPKKPFDCCREAHIYQIQVTEDGRTRYRLRLGPFVFEDEADAVLHDIREIYPAALTATACALDIRTVDSLQAKEEAKKPQLRKPAKAALDKAASAERAASAEKAASSEKAASIGLALERAAAAAAAAERAAAERAAAERAAAERIAQKLAAERIAAERAAAEWAAQKLAAERAAAERDAAERAAAERAAQRLAAEKLAAEKAAAERVAAERAAAERTAQRLAAERAAAEKLAAERAAAERAAQKLAAEKLAAEKAAAERAAAERLAAERAAQRLAAERAAAEKLAAERAAAERAAQKLAAEKLAAEKAAAERAAAERLAAERAAQKLAVERAAAEKAAAEKAAAERAAQKLAAEKLAAEKAAAERAAQKLAAERAAAERAAAERLAAEKAAAQKAAAEKVAQKLAAEKLAAEISMDIAFPSVAAPKSAPVLTEVVARILKTPAQKASEAAVPAPVLTEMVKPVRKTRAAKETKAAAPLPAEFGTRVIVKPAPKVPERRVVIPSHFAPTPTPTPTPAPARAPAAMQPTLVATAAMPAAREVRQLNGPLPDLESTQTVRALTPPELEENASRWFVIQLALADHAFDPEAVPNLDIFSEYRLYSVAGTDQGRTVHALRLGFFTEEIAAVMVASYLGAHYDKPTIRRISVAERERFAHQRVEARKDVGETGTHAVIEITDELVARRKRIAAAVMSETSTLNIGQTGLFPIR